MPDEQIRTLDSETVIELRDESLRELDIRVVPWNVVIHHELGPEMFERGAFADLDPKSSTLIGPISDGTHRGPLVGRGMRVEERDDGGYVTYKVSKTQAGDELLTLAADGVVTGASAGYIELPGGHTTRSINGQRVRVQQRVKLDHVAITHRPAYASAGIVAMRSQPGEGAPVPEPTEQEAIKAPVIDITPLTSAIATMQERSEKNESRFLDRLEKLEERDRQQIVMPQPKEIDRKVRLVDWADYALRSLSGLPISAREIHERDLEDVVAAENPGVVPDSISTDLVGLINPGRPFLTSTRQIVAPDSGMSIVIPVLNTRSTADVQSEEKGDIESTAMKVGTRTFDGVSIFGGADVSIQLIRRANRSFIDLLMQDLGIAYASQADTQAIAALFSAGTTPGGADINPEDLLIGEAWANSINAYGQPPDTIWMSSDGVAAFIDAKADTTNQPLYFTLNGNFGAGVGPGGTVSALRPVYVPALNATGVDVMVGPSSGFVWAEDGTFELSADNPGKGGRDIALGGILFFVPRYAAAFTTYDLGS